MSKDNSREIFETFYQSGGNRKVRVTLKDGKLFEGRFIGFFRGDEEQGEPYIFRWHFISEGNPLFDYDKTIDPDQGFFIEQKDIIKAEFI